MLYHFFENSHFQELLDNQAILNCQLLEIFNDKIFNEPSVDSLFNWLHYKKINFDNACRNLCLMKYNMANELIEKCKKASFFWKILKNKNNF